MAKLAQIEIRNRRAPQRPAWLALLGQIVSSFDDVPMPMHAPRCTTRRSCSIGTAFCSDTSSPLPGCRLMFCMKFPRPSRHRQLRALHENSITSDMPPPWTRFRRKQRAIKTKSAELACDIDILRSLKKSDVRTPDRRLRLWVIEQKAARLTGRTSTRSCVPASSGCSPTN